MKQFFKTLLASFVGALLALGIISLFFFSMISSLASFAESTTPVVPSKAILKLDFQKGISEQDTDQPFDLSSLNPYMSKASSTIGILKFVQAIDKAAEDPAIKFIYMNTSGLMSTTSQLEEVRDALLRFRNSGKAIISYSDLLTQGGYYLSSVSDKVFVEEETMNEILGISLNVVFLKDALDRLGVELQLIRHGKYKSAGEQFIANSMSDANREQNKAMIDSMWETMATAICESRGIDLKEFNRKVNDLELATSEELLAAHLIDSILTKTQLSDYLCTLFDVKKEDNLKFVTIDDYAKAVVKPNMKAKEKIAVIYADGEITLGKGEGVSSDKYRDIISKVRKDSTIKAVVLRVNSPGGSAQAAEIIRKELILLKEAKPLIVSFGEYAASGGYWISAGADKIFTDATTLTGSIGVFSLIPSFGKTARTKLHVNPVPVSTHNHSDMYSFLRPLDKKEVEVMQRQVEVVYTSFVEIVSNGRNISKEGVDNIAQGRVWTGKDALTINLADSKGGLYDALSYAVSISGLENYRLVEYPAVKTSMEKVMETFNKTQATIKSVSTPDAMVDYIYDRLRTEKGIYARLPYIYYFN